ncbi:MAG: hypothetical protein CM15mP83_0280 [Flavobacteriaceae bacterium]|nr:MAG: hypothetical protein CM15mP83_0280 [Flavobacteriaceae bacterium]
MQDLANKGIRVIVAGLDMDYKGNPFGPMPNLMATAEYVTKVHASAHALVILHSIVFVNPTMKIWCFLDRLASTNPSVSSILSFNGNGQNKTKNP